MLDHSTVQLLPPKYKQSPLLTGVTPSCRLTARWSLPFCPIPFGLTLASSPFEDEDDDKYENEILLASLNPSE